MPNFGHSPSNASFTAASAALSVDPYSFGLSQSSANFTVAGVSLTMSGGQFGPSPSLGGFTAAGLTLAMDSKFGVSASRAALGGSIAPRLAVYEVVQEAIPGTPTVLELDFSGYDGSTPFRVRINVSGGSHDIIINIEEVAYPAGVVPPFSATLGNLYASQQSETVLHYVSQINGLPIASVELTEYHTGDPFLQVTSNLTIGDADTPAITALVTPATDGFVVECPLWMGRKDFSLFTAESTGMLRSAEKLFNLYDLGRDVYALWGYEIKNLRDIEIGRERIVTWVNSAMQTIYARSANLEFFNRERITVTVPTLGSVALPASVQAVHGEARIAGRALKPLSSYAQAQSFSGIYPGASVPIAFLVESTRQGAADSLAMTLYVVPAPSESTAVEVEVTKEPPRYDVPDLLNGVVIELPHKWVETLLRPLVMKWAVADNLMPGSRRTQQMDEINAQYVTAQEILGLADIDPPPVKKERETA